MSRVETILLATDGTPASQAADEQAILLAAELGARLLVVSVINTTARLPVEAMVPGGLAGIADEREALATTVQGIVQRARAAGAQATFLVWEGDPAEAIVAAAEAEHADLIVVGSHGRGPVGRFLIGSVSDHVVRHAGCPVLVVRATPELQPRPADRPSERPAHVSHP